MPKSVAIHTKLVASTAVAFGALTLAAPNVSAQLWYYEAGASFGTFYDDNPQLASGSSAGSFGGTLNAAAWVGRSTEASDIGVSLAADRRLFTDASDLDSTDGTLGLRSSYRLDRHRFGLGANLSYLSTQTSELQTSGLVQVNKPQISVLIAPSWGYALSERTNLDLFLSYQDVSYQDVGDIPLFNYVSTNAGATLGYQWSERLQLLAQTSYAGYDARQVDTADSTTYGLQLGARYLLSERTSIRALAGVRYADAQTPTVDGLVDTSTTGPLFELELQRQFAVGGFSLAAERSLLPSSQGTLLDTTGLRVAFDYPVTPLWSFGLGAQAYRNRNPGGEITSNDRDFISLSPSLRRRLTESLSLDLTYRVNWQTRETGDDDSISNSIFLGLRYTWPRAPLGRLWPFTQ
jgi:hypothetical protein